jgi:hypothetical protein
MTAAAGAGMTLLGLGSGVTHLFLERRAAQRYQNRAHALGDDACHEPGEGQEARCASLPRLLGEQHQARRRAGLWFGAAAAGAAITWTGIWLGSSGAVAASATFTPRGVTLGLKASR